MDGVLWCYCNQCNFFSPEFVYIYIFVSESVLEKVVILGFGKVKRPNHLAFRCTETDETDSITLSADTGGKL